MRPSSLYVCFEGSVIQSCLWAVFTAMMEALHFVLPAIDICIVDTFGQFSWVTFGVLLASDLAGCLAAQPLFAYFVLLSLQVIKTDCKWPPNLGRNTIESDPSGMREAGGASFGNLTWSHDGSSQESMVVNMGDQRDDVGIVMPYRVEQAWRRICALWFMSNVRRQSD